jgi:hypothetical protein
MALNQRMLRIGTFICGLSLLAMLHPAEAGCLCKNYSKDTFCVENIPACQQKAGNCLAECAFNKKPDFPVYEKGPPIQPLVQGTRVR